MRNCLSRVHNTSSSRDDAATAADDRKGLHYKLSSSLTTTKRVVDVERRRKATQKYPAEQLIIYMCVWKKARDPRVVLSRQLAGSSFVVLITRELSFDRVRGPLCDEEPGPTMMTVTTTRAALKKHRQIDCFELHRRGTTSCFPAKSKARKKKLYYICLSYWSQSFI